MRIFNRKQNFVLDIMYVNLISELIINMFKIKTPKFIYFLPVIIILSGNCATARKIERHSNFDYQNIYNQKYKDGNGGIMMVTLEKGETYSGSITPDQKYIFYTSNQNGNFDIFMRPLNDIISIPVIRGATNQTQPAISPDGKYLLFIDDELDPDGDIVMVKINPKSVEKLFLQSGQSAIDAMFINSKIYLTNNKKNIIRSKENNPAWSPDGKWIAFASNKPSSGSNSFGPGFGALQNIWIMPFGNPDKATQLTKNGGTMPVFSRDGSKILYVNGNDSDNITHIYEVEINTGISRQITSEQYIDLSPGYSSNGKNIIFTRIYNDTNNDGVIDYKDHGQIMLIPSSNNISNSELKTDIFKVNPIQLTSKNNNIFNTQITGFLGGSILFAIKEGDNINLAIIPETGIYPIKKSSIEQLDYTLNLPKPTSEDFKMSFSQIEFIHENDPLKYFTSTISDFELLEHFKLQKSEKENVLNIINKKISENDLFEKVMLDIYYKNHPDYEPQNYTYLFPEKSLELYYKHVYNNPASILKSQSKTSENIDLNIEKSEQKINKLKLNTLSKYDQTILGFLYEQYAQSIYQKGKIEKTRIIYQNILSNLPEYYNNSNVLYTIGKNSFDTEIPLEFLHIIFPDRYPYKIKLNLNNSLSTENTPEDSQFIKVMEDEKVKSKVENEIYQYFKKIYSQNQELLIKTVIQKYTKENDTFIYNLGKLSLSENLFDKNKFDEALLTLKEIDVSSFNNTEWIFKYNLLQGRILEKLKQIESAFEIYANALLVYENKYNSIEVENLTYSVFNHYSKLAKAENLSGKIDKAWSAYSTLLNLILYLEPKKIATKVVSQSSLKIFTELDEMLLKNYYLENDTIKQVLGYYSNNISFARINTINSFIFGRAYLNAMLGIKLHQLYESKRELNIINKESILTYFSEAEEDFQWSIYADSSFADSYVMLGWMYQYIDEKRDSSVYLAKIGNETEVDKVIFKSLYEKYFPDYLFEKNIQLYHKSIAFLSGKSSNQILKSFYLNLANNYFLLNNYTKADEYYSKIDVNGNEKFKFENSLQKAQYYFHIGKTNYFLGHYNDAINNLETALTFYPINLSRSTDQNFNNLKRSLVLKYIGLVYSDQGQYSKAVNVYKQIIKETIQTNESEEVNNLFTSLYLEISRNSLAQIKVTHNLSNFDEALNYTIQAELLLKRSKEVLAPKFPYKLKILGFTLPFKFNFGNYDDTYKNGDNHIAFRLPTINQYQYLYSIQADLYKLNGNYSKASESIKNLIKYAEKDDTKHGNETRISAYMRLGELAYIQGNLNESQSAYTQSKKVSLSENKMHTYYLSEKNLMTIACNEIEKTYPAVNKLKLARQYLTELTDFKNEYIKLKYSQAQKELSKKNSKMKLSLAELSYIEREAINDINGILIYQGVLEAFISTSNDTISKTEKFGDINKYYEYKFNHFVSHNNALTTLDGNFKINNTILPLLNKKTQKHLAMKLDMNKAMVLESMGRKKEAMDIYLDISQKAYEYKANGLFIIAGYRAYVLAKSLNIDAQKLLKNIDLTFKTNPYLIKQYITIYQNLGDMIFEENIGKKQYYNAIYMDNYNRMLELQDTIDVVLSKTNSELIKTLNAYKEFDIIEEILASDIENLKIKRESTEIQESIMEQLINKKNTLKQNILKDPEMAGFALARFPDILTVNDIINLKPGYLYLIKRNKVVSAISKNPDSEKLEYNSFIINDEELNKFIDLMKNTTFDKNNQNEMSKELNRFVNWIRIKQFKIIFPDKAFSFFPFSKILNYNVATEYTFQAAILFEKNQSITNTNWIQNVKNSTQNITGDKNHYIYNYITSPEDFEKLKIKYNAIDYEITDDDFSEKKSTLLSKIINNNEKTSITFLSYNFKNIEKLSLYMNTLNLLFAASKSSMVFHTAHDHKFASETYSKLLDHKNDHNDDLSFDGNLNVIQSFFNINKDENKNFYIQTQKQDLQNCTLKADKLAKGENVQEAIVTLNMCENIDFDLKRNQLSFNNINIENIKPNYDLFIKKIELMLDKNSSYNINDIQKTFESFTSNVHLNDDASKNEFSLNITKYISLLFANGEKQAAAKTIKDYQENYKQNDNELIKIIDNYFSGQMLKGEIQSFITSLPKEIELFNQNQNILNDIPTEKNDKIKYFIKSSNLSQRWFKSLLISGEYSILSNMLVNNTYKMDLWEAISFYESTGKIAPTIKDTSEIDWIRQLCENPKDTNVYFNILNESKDEYVKAYARLIVMFDLKNYDNIFSELKFLTSNHENDIKQDYYIKQATINYVLHHIDYYSSPEDFINNVLKYISSIKLNVDTDNKQQMIFQNLTTLAMSLIMKPDELNKFQNNYKDNLSEVNIKYIQSLKNLSLQYNPYEVVSQSQNDENLQFNNNEFTDSLTKLVNNSSGLKSKNINFKDYSLLMLYNLKSKVNQKTLFDYFTYDRNETAINFPFIKNVHGIIKIYFDQYYYWTWKKDKIEFDKIKFSDVDKLLQKNYDDIFYLPAKDESITNKLLALDVGLQYFTTSTTAIENRENTLTDTITWSFNPGLINTPGYSIMKMYLPASPTENEKPVSIGLNSDIVDGNSNVLINFYSQPMALDSFKKIDGKSYGNFHIIYTQPEKLNVYLVFMKEYIKYMIGNNEKSNQPVIIFDLVLKSMEKNNMLTNDLKYIKLIQK
ncbi:MAG: hypothetical protein OEV78_06830 [Spirochaetia bacterium]|nr:hypothetical protein [Spirochaetia bacterium]